MKTGTETKRAELYVSECCLFETTITEEPNHHALSDERIRSKTHLVPSYSASVLSASLCLPL
jgi:hypothetical protein